MKEKIKVKVNQIVYCIYEDINILAEPIYAIGEDFFLLDPHGTNENSWEWYFEDYNRTWFTNLEQAKATLWENYLDENDLDEEDINNLEIKQIGKDYYELIDKREG